MVTCAQDIQGGEHDITKVRIFEFKDLTIM